MKRFVSVGECMIEMSETSTPGLWQQGVAGDTLNTAWYARSCLSENWQVDYLTRIGTDAFSTSILDFLRCNKIGTDHVQRDTERGAGLYAISLENGERSFTYWRAASAARRLAEDAEALAVAFQGAALVFLSGISIAILPTSGRETLLAAISACKTAGALIAFDPNIRLSLWEDPVTARNWLARFATVSSVLLPSFDDEAAVFGDQSPSHTLQRYAALNVPEVVVKNGGQSMQWLCGAQSGVISALDRVSPIDTTGAGDSFNGAYLAARLRGDQVVKAISAGHDMASRVIMHKGALLPF